MSTLKLFEGIGIELEYMIVDSEALSVRPIADELLKSVGGGYDLQVDLGAIAWSNELALHVIEMKCNGPVSTLSGLAGQFQEHVARMRQLLRPHSARLLSTAMHPWMDPDRELRLWPHENDVIYQTFDRIFDCRGHGWSNLQSMHINLPFSNDEEFGRLHAAMRMLLPILPALAASSPLVEGKLTGLMDTRVDVYRTNARRIPSVTGLVIPERVFTRADYESKLLAPLYADLAPHDPEGVLQHEWANARGCIARFERMAIEIRLLDLQEYPGADLAIAALVVGALKQLVSESWSSSAVQRSFSEQRLASILQDCVRDADEARITDDEVLRALGCTGQQRAGDVWRSIAERVQRAEPGFGEFEAALAVILERGCLARRIANAVGPKPGRERLTAVYQEIATCLDRGQPFRA
ncbi:MAG TPA: glutamate-cysteine ligase family protein [Polyangiaceae bacterium]|nr:glutamate-cysteine ligase family protein [Polyangiaceae bacterium]